MRWTQAGPLCPFIRGWVEDAGFEIFRPLAQRGDMPEIKLFPSLIAVACVGAVLRPVNENLFDSRTVLDHNPVPATGYLGSLYGHYEVKNKTTLLTAVVEPAISRKQFNLLESIDLVEDAEVGGPRIVSTCYLVILELMDPDRMARFFFGRQKFVRSSHH